MSFTSIPCRGPEPFHCSVPLPSARLSAFSLPFCSRGSGCLWNRVILANKLVYYLFIGGISTFGEEKGWRGFLQDQLKPLGTVRGYLLLAAMWEAWHFTSHFKGSWNEVAIRLSWLLPLLVALTFFLGFITERTGSLLLAVTVHEWVDIIADSGDRGLFWSGIACIPIWAWIVWRWPKRPCTSSNTA